MIGQEQLSRYLSFLLRHKPENLELDMDVHGWVSVAAMLEGINRKKGYSLTMKQLKAIVATDKKGRYRFNENETKIKACQGHTIPWVTPELSYTSPPNMLYHGTTTEALAKIKENGAIEKMKRHAVHLQAEVTKAWQSAERWHKIPVVLQIDAYTMEKDGYVFGQTENHVWCIERVPICYVVSEIFDKE